MKESGKMANRMVKVRKSDFLNDLLILTLLNALNKARNSTLIKADMKESGKKA